LSTSNFFNGTGITGSLTKVRFIVCAKICIKTISKVSCTSQERKDKKGKIKEELVTWLVFFEVAFDEIIII